MERMKKFLGPTNVNTIITLIGIVVGLPSFYAFTKDYMTLEDGIHFAVVFLLVLLLYSMYSNSKIIKKYNDAEKDAKQEREKLGKEILTLKDQSAKLEDLAAIRLSELTRWQDNCAILRKSHNVSQQKINNYQRELDRVYESDRSLNPYHQVTYMMGGSTLPETPLEAKSMGVFKQLDEMGK
jgi:hypothetical protein